jgi:hypothetical protein
MGCYVNPKDETKEAFLNRVGISLLNAPDWAVDKGVDDGIR